VFVDFTAAWCVTCQYNKRTTLAEAEVKADFAASKVVLLRADWTRRDAAHQRRADPPGPQRRAGLRAVCPWRCRATLLSEILTVAEVTDALATLR
jgi:hypothetical protein